jgi:hypothetical protein
MIRNAVTALFAATALLVAPAALRPAVNSPANAFADNLGRGEIVGRVVHRVGTFHRTLQVMANGQEWTLNVPNGTPVTGDHNYLRSIHDVHNGTYVRAVGTRIGALRLRTDRVFIVGDRLAMAIHRYPLRGYYASYAGYRGRYGGHRIRHR